MKTPQLSGQPVLVFRHSCSKKCFLMFKENSLYFSLCPLHHVISAGTTEKSLAPSSLLPPIRCLYTLQWDSQSLLFLRLHNPSSLILFSYLQTLNILCGLCWMNTIKPYLSSTREPRTRHSTLDMVSIKFNEGEKPPSWTCWQDSSKQSPG